MTLTIMKGTVHRALDGFDTELTNAANNPIYRAENNGIIVSTVHENGFTYHWAENPIVRSVRVTVIEEGEGKLKAELVVAGNVKWSWDLEYPFIFKRNQEILNFLVHGTLPKGTM